MSNKNKVKALFILWVISLLIVYMHSAVRYVNIQKDNLQISNEIDLYSVLLYVLVAVYFVPLLISIRKYANLAQLHALERVVHFLIFLFVGVLVLAPISLVCVYIAG